MEPRSHVTCTILLLPCSSTSDKELSRQQVSPDQFSLPFEGINLTAEKGEKRVSTDKNKHCDYSTTLVLCGKKKINIGMPYKRVTQLCYIEIQQPIIK